MSMEKEHCHDECCCCGHNGEHEEAEVSLKKIIAAAVFFLAAVITEYILPSFMGVSVNIIKSVSLAFYAAAYLLCGFNVLREAVESVFHGKYFNEEFLMAAATVGAVAIGEYSEAVAVMILFEIGEMLEDKASEKTRKSISNLMNIRPDTACVLRMGKEFSVEAADVKIGETIIVRPGERIPLDGKIISGKSMADTSALTGESVPREISEGDSVLSGFVNTSGVIEILVEKEFKESTVSRVLEMVENAQEKKAHAERFITRFARIYTPVVCLAALCVAVIPPLVFGGIWKTWIYRACEMLVVSCPCALVISVPLSFFAGIGRASKLGILIKGSNYIENLSKIKTVVFDKTGTLTKGVFEVTEVHAVENSGMTDDGLVSMVTHAEYYSDHPISKSLKAFHRCEKCGTLTVAEAEEISGHGIKCLLEGKRILAGNKKLMLRENVESFVPCTDDKAGSIVYVAADGKFMGWIIISDIVKEDSADSVRNLHDLGIKSVVMLTGDTESNANKIASEIGIDDVRSELLPQEKVEELEVIIENSRKSGGKVMFVGDGINDAPVLSRSDVGVAMGALGSDAAIEAADVVIMDDKMMRIPEAVKSAKKTMCNVKQNIIFSLGVKILILLLCAAGIANMWAAVFGDVGVCMITILNSTRLLKSVGIKKKVSV